MHYTIVARRRWQRELSKCFLLFFLFFFWLTDNSHTNCSAVALIAYTYFIHFIVCSVCKAKHKTIHVSIDVANFWLCLLAVCIIITSHFDPPMVGVTVKGSQICLFHQQLRANTRTTRWWWWKEEEEEANVVICSRSSLFAAFVFDGFSPMQTSWGGCSRGLVSQEKHSSA